MDAEKIASTLDSRKVAVLGDKTTTFGISREFAEELRNLIEFVVGEQEFSGYALVNGETLVFRKKNEKTILAFVDDEKLMGSMRKIMEL